MLCTSCGRLKATEGYFEASRERCGMSIYSGSSSGGFDTDTTKQLCGIEEYMRIALEVQVYWDLCHDLFRSTAFNICYYRQFLKRDGKIPEFRSWNYDAWFKAFIDEDKQSQENA